MAISEHDRFEMHGALRRALGDEAANTMMEHLPPVGWSDVATTQDLEHQRVALSSDIEHQRVALSSEIEGLRVSVAKDIEHLRTSIAQDMTQLRTATSADLGEGLASLKDEIRKHMDSQLRWMVSVQVTVLLAVVAALR